MFLLKLFGFVLRLNPPLEAPIFEVPNIVFDSVLLPFIEDPTKLL